MISALLAAAFLGQVHTLELAQYEPAILSITVELPDGQEAKPGPWFVTRGQERKHYAFPVDEGGRFFAFCAEPGEYTVSGMVFVVDQDGRFQGYRQSTYRITCRGPPGPDDPNDDDDDPDPTLPLAELQADIRQWGAKVTTTPDRKAEAQAIGQAFLDNAANPGTDLARLTEKTSATYRAAIGLNTYLVWQVQVFSPLKQRLTELAAGLSSDDYGALWRAIGDAFQSIP